MYSTLVFLADSCEDDILDSISIQLQYKRSNNIDNVVDTDSCFFEFG